MATTWRAALSASVTAVAATAALALVVDAAPAPDRPGAPVAAAHRAAASARAVTPPALPPVTEHSIDPEVLAAASSLSGPAGGQSMVQVIELTVVGGALELLTHDATVTLERVPGSDKDWVGALPPVRVVDARGTHEGWTVDWTVTSVEVVDATTAAHVPFAKVRLEPGAPVVVAGLPDGVTAGKGGPSVPKGRTLFAAAPGAGGGTYEAGATVTMRLPKRIDTTSVVVRLAFSVA